MPQKGFSDLGVCAHQGNISLAYLIDGMIYIRGYQLASRAYSLLVT